MAFSFDVNGGSPGTGAAAVFRVKTLLKSVTWTVPSSSDGTTYNATGDQITGSGTGANGMHNNRAWFRARQPGANARELTFQHENSGSSSVGWRIKYSGGPGTGFTGGSPGATQTPSATDEQILLGGGTDASPTFGTLFDTPETGWRFNAGADAAAPYGFYFWTHLNTVTQARTVFVFDPLLTGTSHVSDVDPLVIYHKEFSTALLLTTDIALAAGVAQGWIRKGLSGSGFVAISALMYYNAAPAVVFPTGAGQDPYNTKEQFMPVMYGRASNQTAPFGFKGVSSLMKWAGIARACFDTFNIATTKDYIALSGTSATSHIILPWAGVDVTL